MKTKKEKIFKLSEKKHNAYISDKISLQRKYNTEINSLIKEINSKELRLWLLDNLQDWVKHDILTELFVVRGEHDLKEQLINLLNSKDSYVRLTTDLILNYMIKTR